MLERLLRVADAETRTSRVLSRHVWHDGDGDHLLGDGQRFLEALRFHMSQIELAEQHRLRRSIVALLGKAACRVFGAKGGRPRQSRLFEEV